MEFISIGLGNYISAFHLVAVVSPESAPVKRLIQEAKDRGQAVDSTYGRRTRAVIIMDSGQVILSSIQPETIVDRSTKKPQKGV